MGGLKHDKFYFMLSDITKEEIFKENNFSLIIYKMHNIILKVSF